jgi:hypothetical protein
MKMGYINIEERGVSGLGWDDGLQSISRHGNGGIGVTHGNWETY